MSAAHNPAPKHSPNFAYLAHHDPRLAMRATLAEQFFSADPTTCLMNLRLFGELLAQRAAAKLGIAIEPRATQVEVLRALQDRGALSYTVRDLFHSLRKQGNEATHGQGALARDALHQLKMARQLGIWFQQSFGNNRKFDPGPFVPPPSEGGNSALEAELKQLREELSQRSAESEAGKQQQLAWQTEIEEQRNQRLSAEEQHQQAADEQVLWETLAQESEAKAANIEAAHKHELDRVTQRFEKELQALRAQAQERKPAEQEAAVKQAATVGSNLTLTEQETRHLIDQQLRDAGWEVDTETLRHSKGTRPEKHKNRAIAEWPTGPQGKRSERADYVLFVGLQAVGIVEAKKAAVDVPSALRQSKRYSQGFKIKDNLLSTGGPWGPYQVPFLFATNGRPYLEQLRTKSGIWFWDARQSTNPSLPLRGWPSPGGLQAELEQDAVGAHKKLQQEPTDYLELRDYQLDAIESVERAIEAGQRSCLVAMATGTGKTRTAMGLIYRLIKSKRFRRVLFLVDRTALGQQAQDAFTTTRLENLQTFAEIFDIKELGDTSPDKDTKLQFATVQGMVHRIINPSEPSDVPPVDAYDCIVIDECHRGYSLDKEMTEAELEFRDQNDYLSKYRQAMDHFNAVKIGLTATPALHTSEIFGRPIVSYSYREAVIDGYLVDHEPPISLITKLAEEGIHWDKGEEVHVYNPESQSVDLVELPDDVDIEIESFNKTVVTEGFNRVVCRELARQIDPSLPAKTLIFCATDLHADSVVLLLKEAFREEYGEVDNDAVVKITGSADKPLQLLRRYKNEAMPNVAVTVDLLTTGIDVPAISNLVFLRRVRSRILYDQMLGRATRLCPDIGKTSFRIFDAVALYSALSDITKMKPVASPSVTVEQLVLELAKSNSEGARQLALEQLIAKLQSKKQRLKDASLERFEEMAAMSPGDLAKQLKDNGPQQALEWFDRHPALVDFLDERVSQRQMLMISDREDELLRIEHGYGKGRKPGDYLEEFKKFIEENMNQLPALVVVTQRPSDLTRAALKELALKLDVAGFNARHLQTAWLHKTNADIAANIMGFIRQAALGDPLIDYQERVDRALKKLVGSRSWTAPQRGWLKRIGKQLVAEKVVDRAALDEEPFKGEGGYKRINKVFGGEIEDILSELQRDLWDNAS